MSNALGELDFQGMGAKEFLLAFRRERRSFIEDHKTKIERRIKALEADYHRCYQQYAEGIARGEKDGYLSAELVTRETMLSRSHYELVKLKETLMAPDHEVSPEYEIREILRLGSPKGVSSNTAVIRTGLILLKTSGRRSWEIGPFDVFLRISTNEVRIQGVPGALRIKGFFHPHVEPGGRPNLRGFGFDIRSHLAAGEVGHLCAAVREFLTRYDPGTAFVRWE